MEGGREGEQVGFVTQISSQLDVNEERAMEKNDREHSQTE